MIKLTTNIAPEQSEFWALTTPGELNGPVKPYADVTQNRGGRSDLDALIATSTAATSRWQQSTEQGTNERTNKRQRQDGNNQPNEERMNEPTSGNGNGNTQRGSGMASSGIMVIVFGKDRGIDSPVFKCWHSIL
jgi:hypothetical protein